MKPYAEVAVDDINVRVRTAATHARSGGEVDRDIRKTLALESIALELNLIRVALTATKLGGTEE